MAVYISPYPADWSDNWYGQDDAYINQENGYCLQDRGYPYVRLVVTVAP